MKKYFFILVSLFCLLNSNVKADSLCDYKQLAEINSKATNIKANFEVIKEMVHFDDDSAIKRFFKVSILNVTDEFYVVVKNNNDEKEIMYESKDAKNGIISFSLYELSKVVNYTFEIYTNSKTECPDEKVRTIYLTIPRYNEYSRRSICNEYPDFYLCQEFVTFSEVDEEIFLKQLDSYQKKVSIKNDDSKNDDSDKDSKKVLDYIDEYKFVIIGSIIIIGVGTIAIIIVRSKKQRYFK